MRPTLPVPTGLWSAAGLLLALAAGGLAAGVVSAGDDAPQAAAGGRTWVAGDAYDLVLWSEDAAGVVAVRFELGYASPVVGMGWHPKGSLEDAAPGSVAAPLHVFRTDPAHGAVSVSLDGLFAVGGVHVDREHGLVTTGAGDASTVWRLGPGGVQEARHHRLCTLPALQDVVERQAADGSIEVQVVQGVPQRCEVETLVAPAAPANRALGWPLRDRRDGAR